MMEDIDCQDVVEVITEYLEGRLSPEEQARLEHHLGECDGCDEYLAQIQRVREMLGEVDLQEITPTGRDRLYGAFRDWKDSKAS